MNPYSSSHGIPGLVTWRAYDFWVLTVGWILVALSCLVVFMLMRSPWGRVLKGIREDEDAVRSLGKNVYAYKMQSLIIGGLFGALAGFVIALRSAAINPSFFATDVTFFAYTVLLLGGAARVFGPVAGALIFWFLITFLDVFFSQATANNLIPDYIMTGTQASLIRFMFMGLALMLLMIYPTSGNLRRPKGAGSRCPLRCHWRLRDRRGGGGAGHPRRHLDQPRCPGRRPTQARGCEVRPDPRGRQRTPHLRRPDRSRCRARGDPARGDHRTHRAQRRRQDHVLQPAHRVRRARRRGVVVQRPQPEGRAGVPGGAPRHGADLPAHQGPVPADRRGEHAHRRHGPEGRDPAARDVPLRCGGPRRTTSPRGRTPCSSASCSMPSGRTSPARSPAGSASCSRWLAP